MNDKRPDPDKLLEIVNNDRALNARGHLKIFFGASAGVGKTYAMLQEARRAFADGRDILVGVVEHHGRKETLELLEGLPVLPLAESDHRGIKVREFDLDGALKRKPALILMDELAHTNAPASRHNKRWQDVEELLENGIDVYSTLNVQHLESVNDMVAKFTGIWVSETVPDKIFDEADEIALIDIPSDELLKRLHDGKVYIAEGANKRAAENFFKKANLVSLRELALRKTAERVDAQSDELNALMGRKENALAPKYLVLLGPDPVSETLIRKAKRMANASKATWCALNIRTDKNANMSEQALARTEHHLRLAERLGAKIVRINGNNPARDILNYAENNGFTRIIVGHKKHPWGLNFLRSLASELIENAEGIEINVINQSNEKFTAKEKPTIDKGIGTYTSYLLSMLIILACTLIGLPFRDYVDANIFTVLFIAGIFIIAAAFGIGPSVISSIVGVAAYNFFFCKPYMTLDFYDLSSRYTFLLMLLTSLFVGSMTAKLSRLVKLSRRDEQEAQVLYGLTKGLSGVRVVKTMAQFAEKHLEEALKYQIILIIDEGDGFKPLDKADLVDVREQSTINWVLNNKQIAGRGTDTLPSAKALYIPVAADDEMMGVIGFVPPAHKPNITNPEIQSFETYASLIAGALARAKRADEAALTKVEAANEKLRNILLSSLSHDLRTPLTIMNGMVSNILKHRKAMPRAAVNETIQLLQQLEHLQKFVSDLLRMASLTSGNIRLNRDEYLIEEIIGSAIKRINPQKGARQILTGASGLVPPIKIDGGLIEQVVINLLENAINHTKDDGIININIGKNNKQIYVAISDNGSGIESGSETMIFEKFRTNNPAKSDMITGSTGLGLAICKGIIEAHDGQISARNNPSGKGAIFTFSIPIELKNDQ